MIRWFFRVGLLVLLAAMTLFVTAQESTSDPEPPRPIPATTAQGEGLLLERYFVALQQGQVGLMRLSGEGIQEARILFRGKQYPFYELAGDGWYALLVADIDAQPRDYNLSVLARLADGSEVTFDGLLTVESGGWVRQNFEVPPALSYLTDPAIERNEYARLDALMETPRVERLWAERLWQLPLNAPLTSGFGQYRILNQNVQTRHTGWDHSAPPGTPVQAIASGEVIFAGRLDIRGNYIFIDHGWGVYSGYAHLSQINVERGMSIEAGQMLGASGNTGRSSGPHLHWEIAVNGEWVDSLLFIETWLP